MRLTLPSAMLSSLLLLQACGSWSQHSPRTQPGVNLGATRVPALPSTPSPYGLSERKSAGAISVRETTKAMNLDPYLGPRNDATQLSAKQVAVSKQTPSRSAAPPSASQAGDGPTTRVAAPPPAVSPEERQQDATRYAAREQQAPALKDFQGGDAVVITMSTLVAVLLVVLLLVLIID